MKAKTLVITGACGFIGAEAVAWFSGRRGWCVVALDNLSRRGEIPRVVKRNADAVVVADIRDLRLQGILGTDPVWGVLHLAAQTAVTTSYLHPEHDFLVNAGGTLEVVQWAKEHGVRSFVYASTNKVYGDLEGVRAPVSDCQPLNPSTPYGVSKATGEMYVRELLGDRSVIFRQSCIYGASQTGTEDQGWVAHVRNCVTSHRPITCYGTGEQVRDLLHVYDLLRAYEIGLQEDGLPVGTYTIGGGMENAFTFSDVVSRLGGKIAEYADWRPHDQRYFVSANDRLEGTGLWQPRVRFLSRWMYENPRYNRGGIRARGYASVT